ncbi:hypothetical protein Pyn_12086 [Prunus yedoensis var. nudiflora]|uniref:Uncharacterized protein n=1 Tax=Prunus yedoensis var. nudiflora TaxID=2094558 RepID=A0A314XWV7_PRUYE|nr:hypothetical protein Pyn_12086 [Prunus yedoensis var. nudiflora]
MKREGRQHGMVRTYGVIPDPLNPRPETRHENRFDSPTAALFTKVATKPTNHSKFTGQGQDQREPQAQVIRRLIQSSFGHLAGCGQPAQLEFFRVFCHGDFGSSVY